MSMWSIWRYPPTPKQMVTTALCFLTSAAIFSYGAHLSYANVAPQQARIKARSDLLREHLRRKYGYVNGKYTLGPRSKK
ncbi:hypothetical protein ZOSMA_34G01200 [Zostera marina]|uniref:Uncharacterized protein n=1 Tax=Zostera marina TaxID=29655 RepID=A0A0K9P9H3_ZOSMR|nr:hypothetical protein ZOSMA_34G01200 [Zostera marina]